MCCHGSEAKTSLYNNKQTGQLIDGPVGGRRCECGGEFAGILGLVGQRAVVKKTATVGARGPEKVQRPLLA